ncbi:Uncharacterised protein [Mycobacterium tuberculosis]|nr:Uncharacterised protein [Mycobacterium tuberculosis]
MHSVQLTVHTHLTLVSQQTLKKQLLVSFLKTKLPTSKKQLKLQNVHSWLSLVVQKFQTRSVLSKTCLKKLIKSLSVVG